MPSEERKGRKDKKGKQIISCRDVVANEDEASLQLLQLPDPPSASHRSRNVQLVFFPLNLSSYYQSLPCHRIIISRW